MDHPSSYYSAQANKSKDKRDRLRAAVREAGSYISTARTQKKALLRDMRPAAWKGNSAKRFASIAKSLDHRVSIYISQMDTIRDGYNSEQAAANTSYLSFLSKWKAAIENEFN